MPPRTQSHASSDDNRRPRHREPGLPSESNDSDSEEGWEVSDEGHRCAACDPLGLDPNVRRHLASIDLDELRPAYQRYAHHLMETRAWSVYDAVHTAKMRSKAEDQRVQDERERRRTQSQITLERMLAQTAAAHQERERRRVAPANARSEAS